MKTGNFQKYAELQLAKRKLEDEIDILKPEVIQEMEDNEMPEHAIDIGKFTLSSNRTWKYPKNIEDIVKVLKEQQEQAKASGTATYEETPKLIFTSSKS